MRKEMKICLPWYKIVASILVIVIMVTIRGVSYMDEIGMALWNPISMLSIMFFVDTYLSEVTGRRQEVFCLYVMYKKVGVILKRILIQFIYLLCTAIFGYGLYLLKEEHLLQINSMNMLLISYLIATVSTILFWGLLSMTIANISRNQWIGIGVSMLIWISVISISGDKILGKWNVASYYLCKLEALAQWEWLCGIGIAMILSIIMSGLIPAIMKRRG